MVTTTKATGAIDRRSIPKDAAETIWQGVGGWPIRRIDWRAKHWSVSPPRGSILFLTGRGDHYEKYLETLSYFADQNWNVTSIDWRGQGLSGRMLADNRVGHIDDFATWIDDLSLFWDDWRKQVPGPHIIIAHSMGGHLAMRATIEDAINPDALVLMAPMLSIHSGGLPLLVTKAFAKLMLVLGRGERAAWKDSEKPMSPATLRAKMLTHSADRYQDEVAWWKLRPGLKLGPASWRWVERAAASVEKIHLPGTFESVKIPVLIAATTADQLVSTKQIIEDSKRLPNAQLMLFGGEAAHELLREGDAVRNQILQEIDTFLDRIVPVND
jgi:lysophospholipase